MNLLHMNITIKKIKDIIVDIVFTSHYMFLQHIVRTLH